MNDKNKNTCLIKESQRTTLQEIFSNMMDSREWTHETDSQEKLCRNEANEAEVVYFDMIKKVPYVKQEVIYVTRSKNKNDSIRLSHVCDIFEHTKKKTFDDNNTNSFVGISKSKIIIVPVKFECKNTLGEWTCNKFILDRKGKEVSDRVFCNFMNNYAPIAFKNSKATKIHKRFS